MQSTSRANTPSPQAPTLVAKGKFDLVLQPQALSQPGTAVGLLRLSIDKVLSGDLVGVSHGEMLVYRMDALGSAGYVAMEKVQGTAWAFWRPGVSIQCHHGPRRTHPKHHRGARLRNG